MKLDTEAILDKYVQIACLPSTSSSTFPDFVESYAPGYGSLWFNGPLPNTLQNVNLDIYNESYCNDVLPLVPKNWDSQICAGDLKGQRDTCQGRLKSIRPYLQTNIF